jgi:hypothetical protein
MNLRPVYLPQAGDAVEVGLANRPLETSAIQTARWCVFLRAVFPYAAR